jgi:hypothetical protein
MARILMCGFEQGHIGVIPLYISGTPAVSTTQKRTGAYSISAAGAGNGFGWTLPANLTELYIRFGLYPQEIWNSDYSESLVLRNSDGDQMVRLLQTFSNLYLSAQVYNGGWGTVATGTIPLTLNNWYCIEVHLKLDNSGDFEVKVNGALDIDFSGDTLGDQTPASIRQVCFGWAGSNAGYATAYYDDIAVNDTTGSVNNTWIGRGGIQPYSQPARVLILKWQLVRVITGTVLRKYPLVTPTTSMTL